MKEPSISEEEFLSETITAEAKPLQITQLTSLRFFAAMGIVLHHLYLAHYLDPGVPGLRSILEGMGSCVAFFFVLSGFILTYTYRQAPMRNLGGRYYVARVARVYPVYLLGLLLSLPSVYRGLAFPGSHGIRHDLLSPLLLDLFLIQAWCPALCIFINGPGWSLSVEAFFYALFPRLLWTKSLDAASSRPLLSSVALMAIGLAPGVILLMVYGAGAMPQGVDYFHSFFPLMRLPEFLLGIVLGAWFLAGGRLPWPRRLVVLTLLLLGLFHWNSGPVLRFLAHNALLAPFFGLIILAMAGLEGGRLRAFLAWRPLVVLGEASFSLYILHKPLKSLWTLVCLGLGCNPRGEIFAATYVAFVIGFSLLAYRWVEVPGRAWLKGQFESRFRRKEV